MKGSSGSIFTIDHDGNLLEFLKDDLLFSRKPPHLLDMVDHHSREKAQLFLEEIRKGSGVIDWEINVEMDGVLAPIHFYGGCHKEEIMVICSSDPMDMDDLQNELTRINNEQTNQFREQMKTEIGLVRKIDEYQVSMDDLAKLNNELMDLQRVLSKKNIELSGLNEQKNRLIGIVSHDLRNPLQAIMTYSEFLLGSKGIDEKERVFAHRIKDSSNYMLSLVEDLLDVSKIESGKMVMNISKHDLVQVIQSVFEVNRTLAEKKGIELSLDRTNETLMLDMDQRKIEQVVNNLIGNAIKYSPAGSKVRISISKDDKGARVSISDEGPGVPMEERDKLFQPFIKGKAGMEKGKESHGLGLAIARSIIEGHRGSIWVESIEGMGATFKFTLPTVSPFPSIQASHPLTSSP